MAARSLGPIVFCSMGIVGALFVILQSNNIIPNIIPGFSTASSLKASGNLENNLIDESVKNLSENIGKISVAVTGVKSSFKSLKKAIESYKSNESDNNSQENKIKELVKNKLLLYDIKQLLGNGENGLNEKMKQNLEGWKKQIIEWNKEIDENIKTLSEKNNNKTQNLEKISKLTNEFSKKIDSLYSEFATILKNQNILKSGYSNSQEILKNWPAFLSTTEKIGLLEGKKLSDYITQKLNFTKPFYFSKNKLLNGTTSNENFDINTNKSTLTFKYENNESDNMWDFFEWDSESNNEDLQIWKSLLDPDSNFHK